MFDRTQVMAYRSEFNWALWFIGFIGFVVFRVLYFVLDGWEAGRLGGWDAAISFEPPSNP
jgi:hypothetical protein